MTAGMAAAILAASTLGRPAALPRIAFVAATSGTAAAVLALAVVCVAHRAVSLRTGQSSVPTD